jgi:hypothetical protein
MTAPPPPRVVLSHTHADKPVVRVLVRRLVAHGVPVWIDERELILGTELAPSIRGHIDGCDVVVVLASSTSAASLWVAREIAFAREHGKPIVPFFVDPLTRDPLFRDFLGVDATLPQAFADRIDALLQNLYAAIGVPVPPPDRDRIGTGLRELAREDPALSPLILGFLDDQGLHQENEAGAYAARFHRLDDAVNAMYDHDPGRRAASHAASAFSHAGAGTRALRRWIAATGDGDTTLAVAVGTRPLAPAWIDTAIALLGACDPVNNAAIAGFLDHHAAVLTPTQRQAIRRLVTWPVRGPERRGVDLGLAALRHLPEAEEVPAMWRRWIRAGAFDGKPCAPAELGRCLALMQHASMTGREVVDEAVREHVRLALRSGDTGRIGTALTHVEVIARAGAPVARELVSEAHAATTSAEWESWRERDPGTAAAQRAEVEAVADAAARRIGSGTCGAG